ncbi:MAG: biopolymer transporter ExbD [Polyangiaceae bacterium]|nr:biopolymer transporter ExbD [Polyangiaceae bacterium]
MPGEKLSAAQRSRIRRIATPRELAPDEEGGELNIVPFLDIITNVLMFVLATITVTFTTMIETEPPRATGSSARPPTKPSLSLNIVIIDKGFIVSAFGQRIGEGCEGPGSGVAVGLKTADGQQDYDYASLTACAKELKTRALHVDEAANETMATITANKDVPYQVVISTIDAIRRSDDGQELFPDINFGVPK